MENPSPNRLYYSRSHGLPVPTIVLRGLTMMRRMVQVQIPKGYVITFVSFMGDIAHLFAIFDAERGIRQMLGYGGHDLSDMYIIRKGWEAHSQVNSFACT